MESNFRVVYFFTFRERLVPFFRQIESFSIKLSFSNGFTCAIRLPDTQRHIAIAAGMLFHVCFISFRVWFDEGKDRDLCACCG